MNLLHCHCRSITQHFRDAGGDFGHYAHANDRGADRPYRVFFADLAKWGRYEIVSDPARADWVFQFWQFCNPGNSGNLGNPLNCATLNDDRGL